jgi:penicillin-binding protein 2
VSAQTVLRAGILGAIALVLFAVLIIRMWALQVISGNEYLRVARDNQIRTVRIQAPRGTIVDRKRRVLVANRLSRVVLVWYADLPQKGEQPNRYQVLKRLAHVLHIPVRKLAREVDSRKSDPLKPVVVREDVGRYASSYILERPDEFPGVEIGTRFVRTYPYGSLAAHLLGYVGEVSKEQLKQDRKGELHSGDIVGRAGVEASFDSYLRGQPGIAQQRVDSRGRPRSELEANPQPLPGSTVRLTLDVDLQKAAEKALYDGITLAWNSECDGCWAADGGAIVALDPNDGAVLAMASYPSYPPWIYAGRVRTKELARWGLTPSTAKKFNIPSLNRASNGVYPPGSTFKPVTALAALQIGGLLDPYKNEHCVGSRVIKGHTFHNWDPNADSWMNLPTALATSCDTYFYDVALKIYGLPETYGSPLQDMARQFGFGQRTGFDVGAEETGILPTRKWQRKHYKAPEDKTWKPGDSVNLAIGQKDLTATPLQMARVYAALANGGQLVTPHLLASVEQNGVITDPVVPKKPKPLAIAASNLEIIREGLYLATHSTVGTSQPVFGSFPVPIAGKTGTAEKWSEKDKRYFDQSWWCGYGPVDKPELVVCALIENGGHGGTAAAPAAREVFESFFHVKGGALVEAIHSD